jgi:hypothetical protein
MPVQHEEIMMKDVMMILIFRNYNKKLSIISHFFLLLILTISADLSGSG